jgi:hypothetical protein
MAQVVRWLVSPEASSVLWPLAVVGLVIALGPVVAHRLGGMRIWRKVVADRARADPRGRDRSYVESLSAFEALGFSPMGTVKTVSWFLTPLNWRKSFPEAVVLASSDRRTLVELYRIFPFEPVRWAVAAVNDAGGLMTVVHPTMGAKPELPANDFRIEVPGVDPAGLVARHREEVAAFCRERSFSVKETSLEEFAALETARDLRALPSMATGNLAWLPLGCLGISAPALLSTAPHRGAHHPSPALWLCFGAGFYLAIRYVYLPVTRGFRILAQRLGI